MYLLDTDIVSNFRRSRPHPNPVSWLKDTDSSMLAVSMFARPSLKSFLIPDPRGRHPKSGADLILAATAIVHGATVVTADKGDFLRIHREFPLPALYEPFGMSWEIGAP